jgi:integrase
MRGSVKKHGPTWRYRVDLDPDPLTGKRRQLTKGGFKTKGAAEAACAKALDDAKRNQLVRASTKTVGQFLKDWIASRKLDMKPTSWQGYRDYLDAYVLPIIGSSALQDLDTVRLNLLYAHLIERGRTKPDRNRLMIDFWMAERREGREPTARELSSAGGVTYDAGRKALVRYRRGQVPPAQSGGLAPKTVRNTHVMLHGALADAVRWNLIARNPATDARPPRVRRKRHLVWNTAQLRTFVDHARGDRYSALWLLVCTTGLRRSELAGLRRDDIDLDRGRISSGDTRVVVRGVAQDSDGKSDDSLRTLALDPVTVTALREYLQRWDEERGRLRALGPAPVLPPGRPPDPPRYHHRVVHAAELGGRPAADPAPRCPPQLRHGRAASRRAREGRERAPRARLRRLHPGHVHARHPRHGRARRPGRCHRDLRTTNGHRRGCDAQRESDSLLAVPKQTV